MLELMAHAYVLIVLSRGPSGTTTMEAFADEVACDTAAKWIEENGFKAACFHRFTIASTDKNQRPSPDALLEAKPSTPSR